MKKKLKKIVKKSPHESRAGIQPLGDRVLVREMSAEDHETKTASGIIIPANGEADKGSKRGEVVAVGPGRHEDGKLIAVSVKPGDRVIFQWGDKLVIDGMVGDHYLVRESEILAVIK